MIVFFAENKLFIMSAVLLAGLISGSSALQKIQDEKAASPAASVKTIDSPAPSAAQTVAPATVSQPKPSIRGRYNGEEEDD